MRKDRIKMEKKDRLKKKMRDANIEGFSKSLKDPRKRERLDDQIIKDALEYVPAVKFLRYRKFQISE